MLQAHIVDLRKVIAFEAGFSRVKRGFICRNVACKSGKNADDRAATC
jgi:hypothetical protein